ncbi:MAG: mannose-6-phosphate isomerase [Solirubrobacteraceae bacterium]|nr:mannose-6-phosphate isomerase [Solirubrobacteraceae bacterium]
MTHVTRDRARGYDPARMDITPEDLPVRVEKPWGHEIWWAWTDDYVGKIIHVDAGHKLSVQYHELKDETSYLLSGRMNLYKGSSLEDLAVTEIAAGHQWRNRPGEVHTIEALEDSDVLEVSTPHLEDVVRLQDAYGREGTSAP